jgi:hypothetical protein
MNPPPDFVIADMQRFNKALAPFIIGVGDTNELGISPEAPQELVDEYRAFIQVCYANGWMP